MLRFAPRDALVVIDVINDFDHEDGAQLLECFRLRLPAMVSTLEQARQTKTPVVYVNDELIPWQSNFPGVIERALKGIGADVVRELLPRPGEYALLKRRYSAFDHTTLDLLLEELEVERLVMIGASIEGCVVQTAIDAREHVFKTTIVANACASARPELEETALTYAESVVGAQIAQAPKTKRAARP
jgi:nicotinamidase-related amidase